MSKEILKVPFDLFRKRVWAMSFSSQKETLKEIIDFKKTYGKNLSMPDLCNIERKHTIVRKAMGLKKNENAAFTEWERNL